MQKPLENERTATGLDDLGALRVRGSDAVRFLQGQLSNDVTKLSAENRSMLAGFHNPQGRVIALLRLVWLGVDDVLAILPRELVPVVVTRLSKYVLRAKVKLTDESESWRIVGVAAPMAPPLDAIVVRIDTMQPRWWLITPSDKSVELMDFAKRDRESWRALDIAAGLPQVYAATSEAFVAQMLNLDALGAIAFDKGCYTGQEVIARAHYRGRVKRRMQRFRSDTALTLGPGDSGRLMDGRIFKIVEIVRSLDGGAEFLAVAPLTSGESADEDKPVGGQMPPLAIEVLPLPYVLGE